MESYQHLSDSTQDNQVEVIRLKKYGCGLQIPVVVSCLSWLGLLLSLLGLSASLSVLFLPWNYSHSIVVYVIATLMWIFSFLFLIFSVNLMRANKAGRWEEVKEMVRRVCSLIGLLQIICGVISLAYSLITVIQSHVKTQPELLVSKVVLMVGSVALITFSSLLLYGVQRKKTKPVQAAFFFNLFMEFFLVITFSIQSSQTESNLILIPVMGLAVSVIHAIYANLVVLVHYNVLLFDNGYYEKNLEFFNRNFNFQM